jgi:hypothetical protein
MQTIIGAGDERFRNRNLLFFKKTASFFRMRTILLCDSRYFAGLRGNREKFTLGDGRRDSL